MKLLGEGYKLTSLFDSTLEGKLYEHVARSGFKWERSLIVIFSRNYSFCVISLNGKFESHTKEQNRLPHLEGGVILKAAKWKKLLKMFK